MKRLIQVATITAIMGTGAIYASNNAEANNTSAMGNGARYHKMMKSKRHNVRKMLHSVFLIQRGLPHYSMILKKFWNDSKLALNDKQKSQLIEVRKETMKNIKELAPKAIKLKREIVKASRNGEDLEKLAKMTDELASLKAKATKVQLKCISETKKILDKKQLEYLHNEMKNMRKMRREHRAKMRAM